MHSLQRQLQLNWSGVTVTYHYTFTCSITVAASNEEDKFWVAGAHSGSNYGRCVDIIAPVSVHTVWRILYILQVICIYYIGWQSALICCICSIQEYIYRLKGIGVHGTLTANHYVPSCLHYYWEQQSFLSCYITRRCYIIYYVHWVFNWHFLWTSIQWGLGIGKYPWCGSKGTPCMSVSVPGVGPCNEEVAGLQLHINL